MAGRREVPKADLAARFRERLAELGLAPGSTLLVAVSGGCDSLVLLHLLRFAVRDLDFRLEAAHLDHAMRPGSAADLAWLRGVCRAWGVPLREERPAAPPRTETAARQARYRFLRAAAAATGADHLLTAHHADDQAETVLFRVLRGTGIRGLRGIPERSAGGLVRPLLPFWREEIAGYARRHHLRWRVDPTNQALEPARNRIRNRILPEVERSFAPAARRSLVGLAARASELDRLLERLVCEAEALAVRREGRAFLIARDVLRGYDSAVSAELVRSLLRRLGSVPDRAGTRSALQFITDAPSGRELELPGGLRLRSEFDTVRLEGGEAAATSEADLPLVVPLPTAGERWHGTTRVGGVTYAVAASRGAPGEERRDGGSAWRLRVPLDGTDFPLTLRGWRPGDRVRTTGGTKTLKKLFLESRVPRSRRHRLPVLTDASGAVLWVGGIDRVLTSPPQPGAESLLLTIAND